MRGFLRRLGPLVLLAALAAMWLVFGRQVPHDQTVHLVLGSAAPRVTELSVGYAEAGRESEPAREATFHWAEGAAPRIVTHEPRLANGDYVVQIQLHARNGSASVTRRVKLEASPVSVDVTQAVP
jgi:hypothetical protein